MSSVALNMHAVIVTVHVMYVHIIITCIIHQIYVNLYMLLMHLLCGGQLLVCVPPPFEILGRGQAGPPHHSNNRFINSSHMFSLFFPFLSYCLASP